MSFHVALLPYAVVGAAALYILVKGARVVVDRATLVAQHYDVPDTVIALTVISIGTSLPEIASHVTASLGILSGTLDPGIASATVLGGNMGSSILQQTLLTGLFIIGYGRLQLGKRFLRTDYLPMVLASGLLLALAVDGIVGRVDALVLLAVFGVYLYYSFDRRERGTTLPGTGSTAVRRDVLYVLLGVVAVVSSSFVVLEVVQRVVVENGLGGSMIGVVTLGVAASLPELTTVMESLRRKAPGIALGTLVGSNIVNPLFAIGLGGLLSTYTVPPSILAWDLPFKIAVGAGLFAYVTVVSDRTLRRREGVLLVIAYFVFIAVRFLFFAGPGS